MTRRRLLIVVLAVVAVLLTVGAPSRARADTFSGNSVACTYTQFTAATVGVEGVSDLHASIRLHQQLGTDGQTGAIGVRWLFSGGGGTQTVWIGSSSVDRYLWVPGMSDQGGMYAHLPSGMTGTARLVVWKAAAYGGCFGVDNVTITITRYGEGSGGGGGYNPPTSAPTPTAPPSTAPGSSPPAGWCWADGTGASPAPTLVPCSDPDQPGGSAAPSPTPSPTPGPHWSEEWGGTIDCHFYRISTTNGGDNQLYICQTYTQPTYGAGTLVAADPPLARLHFVAGRTYRVWFEGRGGQCWVGCTSSPSSQQSLLIWDADAAGNSPSSSTMDVASLTDSGSPFTPSAATVSSYINGATWSDRAELYRYGNSGQVRPDGFDGGYAQFRMGSGGSVYYDLNVRMHVVVTPFIGEATPSPTATPATPAPSGAITPPPGVPSPAGTLPPVPGVGGTTGGFDVCDPQYINAHGAALCASQPVYTFAPAVYDPGGIAALASQLAQKAPFGYGYQAAEALQEAVTSAGGAALPACFMLGTLEVCLPLAEVSASLSPFRSVVLAMMTIVVGLGLVRLAMRAGGGD